MVCLHVNGEPRKFDRELTVSELLEELDVRAPAIAVEVNRDVVPRSEHRECALRDGDRVEIVTFVGGG